MYSRKIKELIIKGNGSLVKATIHEAIYKGCTPEEIMEAMLSAMDTVGEYFKKGTIFVPEAILSSKAVSAGFTVLKPYLSTGSKNSLGKVIIGSVEGDLHDIGKNLIVMLLESLGFEVIDLGVDVPISLFLSAFESNPDAKIIACSAMLTSTLSTLQKTVAAINRSHKHIQAKIMVGGTAVTPEFAERIGADAYTEDAFSAVKKAMELLQIPA